MHRSSRRTQGGREKHLRRADLWCRTLGRHRRVGQRGKQGGNGKLRERRNFGSFLAGVMDTSARAQDQPSLGVLAVMTMLLTV